MSSASTDHFQVMTKGFEEDFRGKSRRNLLLLSGGGSRGAWGAGVLNGWSKSSNGPERERFDVVTGISTGAIQATPAFLGERCDPVLEQAYTTHTTREIYRWGWPFWSLKPLRALLKQNYLQDNVIREVAGIEGRSLYVGIVDLESGDFQSCNLSEMARKRQYDLYRETVLASCANPGFLWPIEIDGRKYVDGGVRYRVYAETIFRAAAEAHAATRTAAQEALCAHVLLNGKPRIGSEKVGWMPTSIMMRGLDIALKEHLMGSLYGLFYQLGRAPLGAQIRLSWIPRGTEIGFPSKEFVPDKMRQLFDAGLSWGQQNQWFTEPEPEVARCELGC